MGRIARWYREKMSSSLYEAYVKTLESGECVTQYEAIEVARKSTAPCYFTSEKHCADIISRMYSGKPTMLRNADKIRKFQAIYEEVERYKEEHDEWPGLFSVCREIVERPAPEFFICHNTAKQMILEERKKRVAEMTRRWVK